jgi:hypothetical protein
MLEANIREPLLANTDAYAAVGIRIVERDGRTVSAEILTAEGLVGVVAEFLVVDKSLLITGVHVDGRGLKRSLFVLLRSSRRGEDVTEVVVQVGIRTSGRYQVKLPSPLLVEVKS